MWIYLLCCAVFMFGYILGALMSEGRKADYFVERKFERNRNKSLEAFAVRIKELFYDGDEIHKEIDSILREMEEK